MSNLLGLDLPMFSAKSQPPTANSPPQHLQIAELSLQHEFDQPEVIATPAIAAVPLQLPSTIDFATSMLFGGSNTPIPSTTQQNPIENAEFPEPKHAPNDLQQISRDSSEFPPEIAEKQVKLLNGDVLTLRKRVKLREISDFADFNQSESIGIDINRLLGELEVQVESENQHPDTTNSAPSPRDTTATSPHNTLWAEKYRPTKFVELVGNEKTNRYILRWLRHWSKAVFNQEVPDNLLTQPHQHSHNTATTPTITDPHNRPHKKVLLLHGPPGIGKTTVAHVIARQLGYEVMEINASDERAGQRVRDKIHNSLTSVTFSGKPVCLIADEVDGAAESGFIRVLVDLVNGDNRAIMARNMTGKSTKNNNKLVMRPIIAICNDLYSPVLEKLRPHCEIVAFRKASERTVKDRLERILLSEGNRQFDHKQLQQIVEVANCDIRSCLNILQFGADSADTRNISSSVHTKDSQMSWFLLVNRLFQRDANISKETQFQRLSRLVDSANIDKVVTGCFQLYPDIAYQDDLFSKPSTISDWLFFHDRVMGSMFEVAPEMGQYSGQTALKFFSLFSEMKNRDDHRKIHNEYEFHELVRSNKELQSRVAAKLPLSLRFLVKRADFAIELFPYLNRVLFPENIKSGVGNIRDLETRKFATITALFRQMDLHIERSRDEFNNPLLDTYPSLDPIANFSASELKQLHSRRNVLIPIILSELDKKINKTGFKRPLQGEDDDIASKRSQISNTVDFFKGKYNDMAKVGVSAKKKSSKNDHNRIWVKYHEGFSNAVRKNITWKDLWEI